MPNRKPYQDSALREIARHIEEHKPFSQVQRMRYLDKLYEADQALLVVIGLRADADSKKGKGK